MAEVNINRELEEKPSTTSKPCRRFRFDKGDRAKSEGTGGRASLLSAFGIFGRPSPQPKPANIPERRVTERVHHLECKAWVGWKKFRGFSMNNALLVDISRGGARIFLDNTPPAQQPVWVYLETPTNHAAVRARVVVSETTPQGQCMLRVEFEEHCPYDFFEAAVCGLAACDPRNRQGREPRKESQGQRELAG